MRIAVIGGGLGGLNATISLTQAGHEVTLFEQRERFTEVGCGISVWPNAMRALDELGLGAEVRAHGIHHCSGAFLSPTGSRLLEPGHGTSRLLETPASSAATRARTRRRN
ncbi:MAG: FAD-dependent monooxygenase, partial [[Mycobacterium] stephanolepidis]